MTHDADFLRLHARGLPHSGIVYCHQRRAGDLVRALLRLADETDDLAGEVRFV